MKNKFLIILSAIGITLGSILYASAAPNTTYQVNLLPQANDTYDLGTTTPAYEWNNLYVKNVKITGTCTGCSSSSFVATSSLAATYPIQIATSPSAITYSIAFGTTTSNTWAGTQTFTNPIVDGTLSGLIAGNSGTTYAVSTTSMNASITGQSGSVANSITFNNGGAGAASGSTFNGGSALTVSYNTIGAQIAGSYESPLTFNTPMMRSVNTISWVGLATTSQPSSSNLLVSNGAAGVYGVGTTSATCGTGVSCTSFNVLGGSNPSFALAALGSAGVLGAQTAVAPTVQATSTLYGTGTGGQVLGWNNTTGGIGWVATSTGSGSGTVGSGTTGQFPYYASSGTTLTATSSIFVAATQNIGIASSTPAYTFSVNNSGNDFYIDSTGKIIGRDVTNNWSGRITPTHSFVFSVATTTEWTASTTGSGYSPFLVMPFTGTLQDVRCIINATSTNSGLGVNTQVNASNATPSYFIASSTAGKIAFTAGNTFSVGQKILTNFGTTTLSDAQGVACTYDVTETP